MKLFKNIFTSSSIDISNVSDNSCVKVRSGNGVNNIIINGNNISASGDIIVRNGQVFVNGQEVTPTNTKEISIIVTGDTGNISVDYCKSFSVSGNVAELQTMSGNVLVRGGISGNLQTTSGDVQSYGNVGGSVQTVSGDVECHQVAGSVKTVSGNIKNKKND